LIRPTNPATLVVAALAAAPVAWLVISAWYNDMPQLPWLPAVTLFVLALVEVVLARGTSARIARKPGRPPVQPLQVARLVVLAKASSLLGAIFGGFSAGLLIWLLIERSRLAAAGRDVPEAAATVIASILLVIAALWLEHSCRVPKRPEDEETHP
jgi:fructose-specific phosphotransferase system IIC component